MGAGVSAGETNDELIDNLIEAEYIKTSIVERICRAVDRGAYLLPGPGVDNFRYRDEAWKSGNIHLSAPCIYSDVLEKLKLKPGLSFLNLGSGTGYLSTMVGLALGAYGINHGVELNEHVIQYAYQRLAEFKRYSGALDEFDFCEPKFMQGNCHQLVPGYHQYDRIYCGAACSGTFTNYLQELMKVGGILVAPHNERLIEIRRISETEWKKFTDLVPVSFSNLVIPENGSTEVVPLFEIEPLSLQDQCRIVIRRLLRSLIASEHPDIKESVKLRSTLKKKLTKTSKKKRDDGECCGRPLKNIEKILAHRRKRFNLTIKRRTLSPSSSSDSSPNNEFSSDSDDSSSNEKEQASGVDPVACSSSSKQEDETESNVTVHREDDDQNEAASSLSAEENGDRCQMGRSRLWHRVDNRFGKEVLVLNIPDYISTSCSDEEEQIRKRRKGTRDRRSGGERFDRVQKADSDSDSHDVGSPTGQQKPNTNGEMMYQSLYTVHMRSKIRELPLPSNMKKFLVFYGDF